MAALPPDFRDCVVALGIPSGESAAWIATGFFYGKMFGEDGAKGLYSTYLVTNRHVLEAAGASVVVRCNPKGANEAREFRVPLQNPDGSPKWLGHPDLAIDVAVLPFHYGALLAGGMEVKYFRSNYAVAQTAEMESEGITDGDGVYVLGFPMGLVGRVRNAVIVRSGTIASISGLLSHLERQFLVDSLVFPGNSGGPVVLRPEAGHIEGTKPHLKAVLIGIVHSYIQYSEPAISPQTGKVRVMFMENSGLAAVHPVDCIEEAIAPHMGSIPLLPDMGSRMLRAAEDHPAGWVLTNRPAAEAAQKEDPTGDRG